MITELFNAVSQHPFWALYIAVLLGIAIHGFRPKNTENHNYYNDDEE